MDEDDDCDVFAAVTAFCNGNELEEIYDKIKPEEEGEDMSAGQDREHIAEIEKIIEYKSTRRKSGRRGRSRKSAANENDSNRPPEIAPQENRTGARGRGRGRRKNRSVQGQSEEIATQSVPEICTVSNVPNSQSVSSNSPNNAEKSSRTRRANRANCTRSAQAPVVAVISLGVDSDSDTGTAPEPIFSSQRGRARRDFLARKASELAAADVIELGSENESPAAELSTGGEGLDLSFDSLNPEVSIKIWWDGKVELFNLRKYQKFSEIIKILAEREKTSMDNIFLNIDERIIDPNDSPDSINYKAYQFISGKVIKNLVISRQDLGFGAKKKKDPNELELKVQSSVWKKPLIVSMRKEEPFKVLYVKCAEELKVSYDNIKLYFDGDFIEFDDTPQNLELEGKEVIDCQMV